MARGSVRALRHADSGTTSVSRLSDEDRALARRPSLIHSWHPRYKAASIAGGQTRHPILLNGDRLADELATVRRSRLDAIRRAPDGARGAPAEFLVKANMLGTIAEGNMRTSASRPIVVVDI